MECRSLLLLFYVMRIIQSPRASAILYQLLVSQKNKRPWLLPANICPIVPITFMKAGVPFEFVDISAESLHMDLDQAETLIKKWEIGGVLYAHMYGEESTPDDFFQIMKSISPETLIVDDRCLCIPEFELGSFADVLLFSTGYAKIVELNFGGYALMKGDISYQPMQLKFNPARHTELEKSYKAAIQSRTQFVYHDSDWLMIDSQLPDWNTYRQQIEIDIKSSLAQRKMLNGIYSSRLPKEIQLPMQYQTWRFNIRAKNKSQILNAIFEDQLFASSHYASLAGIMSDGRAPVAESLADEVINLFNDHRFTPEMAERVCDIILKHAS